LLVFDIRLKTGWTELIIISTEIISKGFQKSWNHWYALIVYYYDRWAVIYLESMDDISIIREHSAFVDIQELIASILM